MRDIDSQLTIVIVDDDDVSVRAIKRALRKHGVTNPIAVARDGVDALELLRGEREDSLEWPYLVLLDINMPRMNGIEFLEATRKDPELTDTVVFVLTTSDDDRDMMAAYKHHIAGYLLKSRAGNDFVNLVAMLENFSITVTFHQKDKTPVGVA